MELSGLLLPCVTSSLLWSWSLCYALITSDKNYHASGSCGYMHVKNVYMPNINNLIIWDQNLLNISISSILFTHMM